MSYSVANNSELQCPITPSLRINESAVYNDDNHCISETYSYQLYSEQMQYHSSSSKVQPHSTVDEHT